MNRVKYGNGLFPHFLAAGRILSTCYQKKGICFCVQLPKTKVRNSSSQREARRHEHSYDSGYMAMAALVFKSSRGESVETTNSSTYVGWLRQRGPPRGSQHVLSALFFEVWCQVSKFPFNIFFLFVTVKVGFFFFPLYGLTQIAN